MDVVYFYQEPPGGAIKIGTTGSVRQRGHTIQVGNWRELVLLGVVLADEWPEAQLHEEFHYARVRGEWFWPVRDLLVFIRRNAVQPEVLAMRKLVEDEDARASAA